MRVREWVIASLYEKPEDYEIPFAPVSIDENGEEWITAENPMKVRR